MKLHELQEKLRIAKANSKKKWSECFKEVSADSIFSFRVFICLFIAGFVALSIGILLFVKDQEAYYFAYMPLFFFGGLTGFISAIRMFTRFGIYRHKIRAIRKPNTRPITNEIERLTKEIQEYTQKIEIANKSLAVETATDLVALKSNEENAAQNVPGLQSTGKSLKRYAENIYNVLLKEYSSFLSPSDWHQLDYIIYLFETGRADSLKESLQLLDDMKRHVELMQVMNHISQTIRTGFNVLNSNMMSCFSAMSNQLSTISGQLGDANTAQAQLIDKLDFHNAMLKKANETSEKMMNDIEYIKKTYI